MNILEKVTVDGSPMYVVEEDNNRMLLLEGFEWGYSIISLDEEQKIQPMYTKLQEQIELLSSTISFQKVLVLGAGCCSFPRFFIKSFGSFVDAVEFSEDVIKVARKYFFVDDYGKQLNLVHDDAVKYVKTCEDTYDLIVDDVFVGMNINKDIIEESSLEQMYRKLNTPGVIVFNLCCEGVEMIETLVRNAESKGYTTKIIEDDDTHQLIVIKE